MNNMKVENWCGYDIRFIEIDGEWWAILKDICDALELRTDKVANRLDPDMLERVLIETSNHPSKRVRSKDRSNALRLRGENKTRWMLAVNEEGIYEALYASRRLEARKFRRWSASVMRKLRSNIGLEGYEVMRMTDPDIQDDIDHILDTLYWDDETGELMQAITVRGGDVVQVPFNETRFV